MLADADELHHVPPEPQLVPLKSFDLHAKNCTVSAEGAARVSESEATDENVCKKPDAIGFVETVAAVKLGAWFTKNGEPVGSLRFPCDAAEHRDGELRSQTNAYHALDSISPAEVV